MSKYKYKLTEEIARWAFEVHLLNNTDWDIVFTNPTAGPWKRIEAKDISGKKGEVHRFPRDSERPDIVAVNDSLKSILIFEAKDTLGKLNHDVQRSKSCKVVGEMAEILGELKDNLFWNHRLDYKIYNALLWGEEGESEKALTKAVLNSYKENLKDCNSFVSLDVLIGIESKRKPDGQIDIIAHSLYDDDKSKIIISSLNIKS